MATKKFDVVVDTGRTYKDAQGQEKKKYINIGVILESERGFMLKLESIPVEWNGFAYLNPPVQRQNQQKQRPPQNRQPSREDFGDMEDDIPF